MRRALAITLALALASHAFSTTTVALTGLVSVDMSSQLGLDEAVEAFQTTEPFAGLGWEVTMDQVGLGGSYLVKFLQADSTNWWLDWYGEGLYLSYHLLGGASGLDPFVRTGLGCAGRVLLRGDGGAASPLAISLFPFVGAGLGIRLGTLDLGAAVDYLPSSGPVPATYIEAYPLGRFQTSLILGFKLGGDRRR